VVIAGDSNPEIKARIKRDAALISFTTQVAAKTGNPQKQIPTG
jgi:hypothetical protein